MINPMRRTDRTRIVRVAVGLILVSTAACGTSEGTTTVMEPTPTPTPTSATSSPTSVGSDDTAKSDFIERVRAAGAESYGVDEQQIEVNEPQSLAPSTCVVAAAWNRKLTGGDSRQFVLLPDGSLTRVGNDEALGQVSKLCFLDNGILPDPDTVPILVLDVGNRQAELALGQAEGTRLLGALGKEWKPPSVTATDDGFVISLFAQNMATSKIFEVTSTITGDSATTDYKPVT